MRQTLRTTSPFITIPLQRYNTKPEGKNELIILQHFHDEVAVFLQTLNTNWRNYGHEKTEQVNERATLFILFESSLQLELIPFTIGLTAVNHGNYAHSNLHCTYLNMTSMVLCQNRTGLITLGVNRRWEWKCVS